MAEAVTTEERLARVEGRLEEMGKIYAAREELARLQDLPDRVDRLKEELSDRVDRLKEELSGRMNRLEGRMDRLESRMDRIPWLILASWLTIALALGGIYFQILQVIGKLS